MYIYSFKLVARCPKNEGVDVYDARIEAREMILAEKIEAFVQECIDKRHFQESLYLEMLQVFPQAETVVLEGSHGNVSVACLTSDDDD